MRPERHTSRTKATIAGVALVIALVVLVALVARHRALRQTLEQEEVPAVMTSPATTLSTAAAPEAHQGFIFGCVTTHDGSIYEGRLRFGGDEEAFWGDYFNGLKEENPWAAHAPLEQLRERRPLEIFGVEVFHWEHQVDLARPFMARFGDIARIEPNGRDLRVTLKSGASAPTNSTATPPAVNSACVRGVIPVSGMPARS